MKKVVFAAVMAVAAAASADMKFGVVDMMVLNCLREREHPTHLSFARAMDYLGQIAPKRARLVHMCHDLTHAQWLERLAGTEIRPAYDGEEITP